MGRLDLVLLLCVIISCSPSAPTLQKAAETHELAMKISEHVGVKIHQIATFAETDSIDPVLRGALRDSLQALTVDYQEWQSAVIGVPGHEPEGHDHHHHEAESPDLTPEMLLEIQQALRHGIIQLNIRSQRILDQLQQRRNEHPEKKEKAPRYGA